MLNLANTQCCFTIVIWSILTELVVFLIYHFLFGLCFSFYEFHRVVFYVAETQWDGSFHYEDSCLFFFFLSWAAAHAFVHFLMAPGRGM